MGRSKNKTADGDHQVETKVSRFRPLQVWPVLVLMLIVVGIQFVPEVVQDGPAMLWMISAFGPLLCSLLLMIWWMTTSRATWLEKIFGALAIVGILVLTGSLVDKSMLGPAMMMLTVPMGIGIFGLVLVLCRNMVSFRRTFYAVLMAAVGFLFSATLKADGVWGNFALGLDWRWKPTVEEVLVARSRSESSENPTKPGGLSGREDLEQLKESLLNPEWSEFRGGNVDGVFSGGVIASNWNSNPPKELWRIAVGPAWSSFLVAGPLLFTQEQRGENEAVVCYDAKDGKVIWNREIKSRFEDALGGPGPRSTPVLSKGQLYVQGARGILARIDPVTSEVVWQKDLLEITKQAAPPMWGFSASPIVVNDLVITYGADSKNGVLAFACDNGELKWSIPSGKFSYSSPQAMKIGDRTVIAMTSEEGLQFIEPADGKIILQYDWRSDGYRACQPHALAGDRFLIPSGMGVGTRLIQLKKDSEPWSAEEIWTSRNLKPDFNDFVLYKDHIYGFDGAIFTCISAETGQRQWKGGRYGKGQVLLLEKSAMLLIATEDGSIVLVSAEPTAHRELARIKAFNGKTWNHPVVVNNRLYIRNAEEAVCYELPLE
jgi:outer membrane protein assembly factor BamB